MNEITTTDMSKFGSRERAMAGELLMASEAQGFPDDFIEVGVTIMMNFNSGNVFFTNEDCQVCMMNGDKLESFYNCSYCGHEGFKDEMWHEGNVECEEYLKEIGVTKDEMGQ